jgi:hypothetical protein
MRGTAERGQRLDPRRSAGRRIGRAEMALSASIVCGRPRSAGTAASLPASARLAARPCCSSLAACTTSVAATNRRSAVTTAGALQHCAKPPPATGMMRESASVGLIWSAGPGPAAGGAGGLPPSFLPRAFAVAARAATLPSCAACSRIKRPAARAAIWVRAAILVRASASFFSRSSRRSSSSGIDTPPGISALGRGQQYRRLGLQRRRQLARMLIRQRTVPARSGVHLGLAQRHRAQFHNPPLAGRQQHLDEQPLTSTTNRAKCRSGSHSSADGGSRNPVCRSTSRKLLIPHPPWYTSPTNLPHHGSAPLKSDRLLGASSTSGDGDDRS